MLVRRNSLAAAAAILGLIGGTGLCWRAYKTRAELAEAARRDRLRADGGDARAQEALSFRYYRGLGVPQSSGEAARWIRKSAEQGYVQAQVRLSSMYSYGEGVPVDDVEAVRWARKAAEQGEPEGQYMLGISYAEGRGVPRDENEAVRWYRKAAEQDYSMAQNALSYMYEHGRGVTLDHVEALRWGRRAAEQGDAQAQSYLGYCYSLGRSVSQDFSESVRWYRKAAGQGELSALRALAGISRRRRRRMILSWPTMVAVIAAALVLFAPQRLWKGKSWPSWAFSSIMGAGMVARELELLPFGFSVPMLRQELIGVFDGGLGRALVILGFGGLSAYSALRALWEFVFGHGAPLSANQADKGLA